jgi:hypothetical protein
MKVIQDKSGTRTELEDGTPLTFQVQKTGTALDAMIEKIGKVQVFKLGMPTAEEVEAHVRAYPTPGRRGAAWLVVDPGNGNPPYPCVSHVHLRVGEPGELITVYDGNNLPGKAAVQGQLLIANGLAFWQQLAKTRWAERSVYTPCTLYGIPVCLLPTEEKP